MAAMFRFIPDDAIVIIFDFLDYPDIGQIRGTCKLLYDYVKENKLDYFNLNYEFSYKYTFGNLRLTAGLVSLYLSGCAEIHSIKGCYICTTSGIKCRLENIKNLWIDECPNLISIESFGGIHLLFADSCENLKYVSNLYDITSVNIYCCDKLVAIKNIQNVYYSFDCSNCCTLKRITDIDSVNYIDASNCTDLKIIQNVENVKIINIRRCCQSLKKENIDQSTYFESRIDISLFEIFNAFNDLIDLI